MSPGLKTFLDQWSSYPSKFIKRTFHPFTEHNGSQLLRFFFEFKDETSPLQKFYQIPLEVMEDIENYGHELDNFWLNFCGHLIKHLETHWISIENEAPIPHRKLDLAIISTLVNPNTKEFSSEVHFSEGIFNGSYFQIKDVKAASNVNTRKAEILFWRNI